MVGWLSNLTRRSRNPMAGSSFTTPRNSWRQGTAWQRWEATRPIMIEKATGQIYITGTAHPLDHYLADYERFHPHRLSGS
jgi:hypothetical protein